MTRSLLLVLVLAACEKNAAAPGARDAGAARPADVSEGVQLIREADAALQAGKLDAAVEKATAALKLEPTHPLGSNVLGRALMLRFEKSHDAKDAAGAKAAFERALEGNPTFWPALQNLGDLAQKEGRPEEAARYYQRLLQAEPQHPDRARYEKVIDAVDAGR
jgi:tetratricopeptide (TPR) repeat protein